MKEGVFIKKNTMNRLILIVPFLILLLGAFIYFIIIPRLYGRIISFDDWLFSSPQSIIDLFAEPNTILPTIYSVCGIRVFWYVWSGCLIVSLFFIGKYFQKKSIKKLDKTSHYSKKVNTVILEIEKKLISINRIENNTKLDIILKKLGFLKEKFYFEFEVGFRNKNGIEYDKEILQRFNFLYDFVMNNFHYSDIEYDKIIELLEDIDLLIDKREEMEKK